MAQIINNIFINGLGMNNKKYQIVHNMENTETMLDVKKRIFANFQIPLNMYYFVCKGKALFDSTTLLDVGFKGDDVLHVKYKCF